MMRLKLAVVADEQYPFGSLHRNRQLAGRAACRLIDDREVEASVSQAQGRSPQTDAGTGDDAPRAGQERLDTALVRADAAGPVTSPLSNGTQAARRKEVV